ncbi:MAG TPA: T9SS type A sorting domain-containing protein [Caldithrix abyssi]|uniref:T9SS type A sorting domain-containing protein n=1 Tax=Caldithrix abyssi TaxID=187145 RepID=A0A7V4WVA9_CALAY|nr:T9SS type A sorting domain-containing protein [Caldithrix abyssi]
MFKMKTFVFSAVIFLWLLFLSGSLFAEGRYSCLFISKKGNSPKDSLLIEHLSKYYDVRVISDGAFYDSTLTVDSLKQYDFGFLSESVRTWTLQYGIPKLTTVPIPLMYLELYASKAAIAGWVSRDGQYGAIFDSTGTGKTVVITDQTGHELAAGFNYGDVVQIVDSTNSDALATLTFCTPEVDYIDIARSQYDAELSVVFGVEAGTQLFDTDSTLSDTLKSENRAAAVGIFSDANDYITEDGYKLIDAGIDWILKGTPDAIGDDITNTIITKYHLDQNYPNPFNPTTEISFYLGKPGFTTLTIYNALGQKVTTLINNKMNSGFHTVSLDASSFTSGVYFYRLVSGEFVQTRKMILLR